VTLGRLELERADRIVSNALVVNLSVDDTEIPNLKAARPRR